MLLICPACGARYEVPASALPAAGRLVRCSACRAEWMAKPQAVAPRPARDPVPEVQPGPVAEAPVAPSSTEAAGSDPMPQAVGPAQTRASADDAVHALAQSIEDVPEARSGVGFLAGFALVTLTVLVALTVYLKHGEIAEALPPAAPALDTYVALVDEGRARLESLADSLRR